MQLVFGLLIVLGFLSNALAMVGQDSLRMVPVHLPEQLQSPMRQFSGMSLCGGILYLLPENRNDKPESDGIYSLMLSDISAALADTAFRIPADGVTKYDFDGIGFVHELPGYEGLEGLEIVGDNFYLTVETDTTNTVGYLVKGKIRDGKFSIIPESVSLPKVTSPEGRQLFNAGFESAKLIGDQLLCLFEYNYAEHNYGYLVDTSLRSPAKKVPLIGKIPFRITDIDKVNDSSLLAVNYFFRLKAESYYFDHLDEKDLKLIADPEGVPYQSFARLLRIDKTADGNWSLVKAWTLPKSGWLANWEGMVKLPDGVLIINDQFLGRGRGTRMMFIELPGF